MKQGWNGGILNIDFDGVIAQTQAASILFHGGPPPYIKEVTTWDSPYMVNIRNDIKSAEFHELLIPYNMAPMAVRGLRDSGWWVRVVTNSPEVRRPLTLNWLNRWHVDIDELRLTPTGNKNSVGPHILIDDRPSSVVEYADHIGPAILVRRPWNDTLSGRQAEYLGEGKLRFPIAHLGSWERIVEQVRTWMHGPTPISPLWVPGRR